MTSLFVLSVDRRTRITASAAVAGALFCQLVWCSPALADLPPLVSTSPIEVAPGAGFDLGRPWFIEVETGDAQAFADRLAVGSARVIAKDRLIVDVSNNPQLRGTASERSLAPTYLVDHEDAAVRALLDQAKAASSSALTAQDLSDFVHSYMEPNLHVSGWLAASSVASQKKGTCSEAAVLLAALARANGIPARVVAGVAILVIEPSPLSVGHGWTEILVDDQWQRFDATQIDRQTEVRYLPELIVDEDIGLELRLMGFTQSHGVRRLRVIGNEKTDASE
jgi:hypothetical protein